MRKLSFILFLLLAMTVPLFAQESTPEEDGVDTEAVPLTQDPPAPPDEDMLFVIAGFEFDIEGRTRPFALIRNGEFEEGEKIQGQTNLENYIRDKTQLLTNQRVLKDNVEISYSVGEQEPDGTYPVTLTIKVEDTENFVVLPYPRIDKNTGFELYIKLRDYNFFGTMNPLRVDLGYHYDENQRSTFMLGVYSDIPFKAFGYNWNIIFNNFFDYRPDVEEPFYYQNVTGLSMELPFRATTFTFGFEESFNVNEENSDRHKKKYGDFQNGLYMSSYLYTSWKIPTGIDVAQYGELTYTPRISATFNHELPKWPLDEFRKGPSLGFNHSLGFEKIDWHANYRDGLSASFSNSYSYNLYRLRNDDDPLSVSFRLSGIGHFIIAEWFGISSKLQYRHWFYHDPEYYEQAGDNLRGIMDKAICADYMLSLNMDFPFRVLLFTPSKWSNREGKYADLFDFELQISPIIDMALYHDPKAEISFNPKNIAVAGGIEFIVFPAHFRSLYARLSLGWNLREFATARPVRLPSGNNFEFSFSTGFFY